MNYKRIYGNILIAILIAFICTGCVDGNITEDTSERETYASADSVINSTLETEAVAAEVTMETQETVQPTVVETEQATKATIMTEAIPTEEKEVTVPILPTENDNGDWGAVTPDDQQRKNIGVYKRT